MSQTFQTAHVKLLAESLIRVEKLSTHYPFTVKQINTVLTADSGIRGYLGWGKPVDFQCMLFSLSQHHTENFNIHTC
jgi:hypothetical protein